MKYTPRGDSVSLDLLMENHAQMLQVVGVSASNWFGREFGVGHSEDEQLTENPL